MTKVSEITSRAIADIIEYYRPVGGKIEEIDAQLAAITKKTSRIFYVDDYGAKGDGITHDAKAINDCITDAGENAVIVFTAGETYLIERSIIPLVGQTFIGYGATIKRSGVVVNTTLTSGIASGIGERTFTVSDPVGMFVGMQLTFSNSVNTVDGNHIIKAINGNSITTDSAYSYPYNFSAGNAVTNVFSMFVNTYKESVKVYGFKFDGNKDIHTHNNIYWQSACNLYINADYNIVKDCRFVNAVADALTVGGLASIADGNNIENCNSNGIHLSGANDCKIINNYIYNTNLRSVTGHNEGAITYSNDIFDTIISGNTFDTCLNGIGSIDSPNNSNSIISNNVYKNCINYGVHIYAGATDTIENILISNNRFISCGLYALYCSADGTIKSLKFSDNLCHNTGLRVNKSKDISVSDNMFTYTTGWVSAPNALIYLTYNTNLDFIGNKIKTDKVYALEVMGNTNALISSNTIEGARTWIINASTISAYNSATHYHVNTLITNNVLLSSIAIIGINALGTISVIGNEIQVTAAGAKGIIIATGAAGASIEATKFVVQNNRVKTVSGVPIHIRTLSNSGIVEGNITNEWNNGGTLYSIWDEGTGNTLANNYKLAA